MYAPLQSNHSKGTQASLAFLSNLVAGSLLLFAASYDNADGPITAVTGPASRRWILIGTQLDATDNQRADLWYLPNNQNVGALTVGFGTGVGAVNSLGASAVVIAEMPEVSTVNALDTSDTLKAFAASSTSTDALTSNSITPELGGQLVVSAAFDQSGTAPTWTAGTGFTVIAQEPGTAAATGSAALEYAVGAAGSQNAAWTINKTGDLVTAQIATFRPPAIPLFRPHRMPLGV